MEETLRENREPILKYDEKKPMLHLVPTMYTRVLARVYEYGLAKYFRDSWKLFTVEKAREDLIPAAMRHLDAYRDGEFFDPDTKLPHLAHSCWNLLTVLWHESKARDMKL